MPALWAYQKRLLIKSFLLEIHHTNVNRQVQCPGNVFFCLLLSQRFNFFLRIARQIFKFFSSAFSFIGNFFFEMLIFSQLNSKKIWKFWNKWKNDFLSIPWKKKCMATCECQVCWTALSRLTRINDCGAIYMGYDSFHIASKWKSIFRFLEFVVLIR